MSEQFCLKWNDFQSTVTNSFKTLRQEEDFFDVTLVSDDEVQMSAHKLILSACSSFFKSILKKNPHQHPLIYLHGIDSTNLGYILDYIYHGEVQLYQDHLDPFMDKAQTLRISGLIASEKDTEREAYSETKNYESLKNNLMDVEKEEYVVDTSNSMVEEFNYETQRKHYAKSSRTIKAVAVTSDNFDLKETINQMIINKGNNTYQCKACGKVGNHDRNMKRHVEIHIDGLSYDCPLCDKTFRSKNSFNFHKYTYHNK